MPSKSNPELPHDNVIAALRRAGGNVSSRTALLKLLKDDHELDRASADSAIDYVTQLGWVRTAEDGKGIDLVNDPEYPVTS